MDTHYRRISDDMCFNVLPEFCDGVQSTTIGGSGAVDSWGTVGDFQITEGEAPLWRVPPVITRGPWQGGCEGTEHVVKRPAEDDVVVTIQEEDDD